MNQKQNISKAQIICGILILCMISCTDRKEKDKSELKEIASVVSMSSSPTCDYDDNVPKDVLVLNRKAMLNYDLSNDCTFQPVHVKIREGEQNSSEIIARFGAEQKEENGEVGYDLNKIEFMYWEIASVPDSIIVKTARVIDTIDDGVAYTKIEVEIARDSYIIGQDGKRKIDFKWEEGPFWIKKGSTIDLHIKNEDEVYDSIYPLERDFITQGKQCTGKAK